MRFPNRFVDRHSVGDQSLNWLIKDSFQKHFNSSVVRSEDPGSVCGTYRRHLTPIHNSSSRGPDSSVFCRYLHRCLLPNPRQTFTNKKYITFKVLISKIKSYFEYNEVVSLHLAAEGRSRGLRDVLVKIMVLLSCHFSDRLWSPHCIPCTGPLPTISSEKFLFKVSFIYM